jgi:hypothetical protein
MPIESSASSTERQHRRRKILIAAGSLLVAAVVAVVVLVTLSNRIIEYGLRKALGENFRVERIAVGWGTIEAEGVQFLKDGQPTASVKRMALRPDLLAILRKSYSVSRLVLEGPVLKLQTDEKGEIVSPIAPPSPPAGAKTPEAPIPPITIKHLVIKNGSLSYIDTSVRKPNSVEARNINLTMDNLSFPFKDKNSKISLDTLLSGDLVAGSVHVDGKINLVSKAMDLNCRLANVSAMNGAGTGPEIRLQEGRFKVSSKGGQSPLFVIADAALKAPFLRVEADRKGDLVLPVPFKDKKTPKPDTKKNEKIRLAVKNLTASNGELLYMDGKIATPPHPLRLTAIALTLDQLRIPFDDTPTTYTMSGKMPGKHTTGDIRISGKTAFKNLDTNAKIAAQDMDITNFGPYIEKKGDARVTRGSLDLNMNAAIHSRIINAPAKTVIRNLELAEGKGVGSRLMGIPRAGLIKLLETSNNRIELDVTIEGNLDNPQFSVGQTIAKRMTVELAKKLGLSVVGIGETAVSEGAKALKGVGGGLKSLGEGVKKLFK